MFGSQFLWGGCPLTILEKLLRARYDASAVYDGGFIYSQLEKRFGIKAMPALITGSLIAIFIASMMLTVKLIF
jgi:hypothetical protein